MRRRLILATVSAVAAAVILLGFPLAFFGGYYVFENESQSVASRAKALAQQVESRVAGGDELTQGLMDRYVGGDDGRIPAFIKVVMPDGAVGTAGDPIEGRKLESVIMTGSTAMITVGVDYWTVVARSAQVVLLVITAAVVAFGAGIVMAVWQANRLSRPLVYLAASAEQLGSGQVRPHLEESGVEEIDLVAAELARSADRLAGRIAAERQFSSDASHQLRTPLTALSMRLEEIAMLSPDSPEVQEEARISLEQVERLVLTVDDLLSRSRTSSGGTTEAVHLLDVLQQQEEEWEAVFAKAGRKLTVTQEGELWVFATPGALAQVIATLLENSLKHGGGHTQVVAKQQGPRNAVVIQVGDEGDGIPEELASIIFERGVTSGEGTGLGLPLARDLAAADGGRLELTRHVPALFTMYLTGVPKTMDPAVVLPQGKPVYVRRRDRRKQ
ncbi:ATP-binding protein [Jonesiaceae bacterium BS-20]|uniref:Signal transduction histidine-protein kinase/phosphatase MprB n=1 Tax=Jonesiaceae bacterium BS-20 TaxID=3120821 RepID=A0AAU7DYC4_9MICO